eukprot:4219066-Amphidinium_carterae.1
MDDNPDELDPDEIYYTNSSISGWFSDGQRIEEVAEGLHYGHLHASDFPPIRVVFYELGWWSLDNR